jgi:hypothetical protein
VGSFFAIEKFLKFSLVVFHKYFFSPHLSRLEAAPTPFTLLFFAPKFRNPQLTFLSSEF